MTTPIIYLSHVPFAIFDNLANNFQGRAQLLNENATLRASVMLLQGRLQRLEALQTENKQLRSLLQSTPVARHLKLLLADVIALQLNPYSQEIMLNKGSKAGVFIGQAVLDAYGIMGQVIEVSPYASRVLLITDPKSGVPIQNSRTGLHGILTGQEKRDLLSWLNVSPNADVKVGDKLFSSGLGGHYPVGYPVGEITHINKHTTDQFLEIDVAPSAKINSSEQVLLVWSVE
jgi:rod shape-determining protein MreC